MKRQSGFTLVEVVVVIAVVALLAAIMTPLIAKNIDDAKLSRAQNEVEVMAAALGNFYKDVGTWPSLNGAGAYNATNILVTGSAAATGVTIAPASSNGWDSSVASVGVDFLDNHLLDNTPEAQAVNIYAAAGPLSWQGPYLETAPLDPWGAPYLVNIDATDTVTPGTGVKGIVISAGPNNVIDTPLATLRTTVPAGDDIATTFSVR